MRYLWSAPLFGAALLSGGVARATDLSAACTPSARLEGEPALIAPIRASLQARGVAEGGALACQRLEVRIMPAHPGYDLFLTDAEGRTDRRHIARADTAAMVIESWLQSDLSDPLLDRGPPATTASFAAPVAVASPVPAAPAVRATAASPGRLLASLRGERAIDGGESMWWGVAAGLGYRVGRLSVGPEAGLRHSAGSPGFTPIAAPVWQERKLDRMWSFEAGVRLEAPLALGRLRLLPGMFLGAGRLSGYWHNDDLPGDRDGGGDRRNRGDGRYGGMDEDAGSFPHHQPFTRIGLRAGAGLGLALPLAGGVAVELSLTAGLRPVAPGLQVGGDVPLVAGLVGHAGVGLGLRYGALP